jgi:glutamyl-tRNA synthetase
VTPDRPGEPTPRGRLAPSPTGLLHVGNARSLLWAWLEARARGGAVLLRIEDLLPGQAEHAGDLLRDLAWLGLDWDEAPDLPGRVEAAALAPELAGRPALIQQSGRAERYAAVAARLVAAGAAYPCVCTRRDIEQAALAPHADGYGPRYPGSCRGRFGSVAAAQRYEAARAARAGRSPLGVALRLRVAEGEARFEDRLRGPQRQDVQATAGDVVIWRKDGGAAYMLAVCVDDAAMAITDVVRGDDLLPATGQQLAVHAALAAHCPELVGGAPRPPAWCHVPLVYGDDGLRLAKRARSLHLRSLAGEGVDPAALRAWIAASLGLPAVGALPALIEAWAARPPAASAPPAVRFGQAEHEALRAGRVPPLRVAAAAAVTAQ